MIILPSNYSLRDRKSYMESMSCRFLSPLSILVSLEASLVSG